MAASIGKVTLKLQSGNTISWPATVTGKIQEGAYKVHMMEYFADEADRDIELLEKQVEGLAAALQSGLRLDEYCVDLEDMRKARQEYRAGPLSDVERRSLTQIRDLAASAIADYEARVGPVPDYHRLVTMFSDTLPFELPGTLANDSSASHHKPAAVNGVDVTC